MTGQILRAVAPGIIRSTGGGGSNLPAYVASGISDARGVANLTPFYPAGYVANDLLLLQVAVRAANGAVTTPAGWTLRWGPDNSGTPLLRQWIFSRVATGTDAALDIAWTGTATGLVAFAVVDAFRVAGATGWVFEGAGVTAGADTTAELPIVTTVGANRLALAYQGQSDNVNTSDPGNGWLKRRQVGTASGDDLGLSFHSIDMPAAGNTPAGTSTIGASLDWVVRGFAISATVV